MASRAWQPLASRRRDDGSLSSGAAALAGLDDVIEVGDMRLEIGSMRVSVRGAELSLTAQEFDLLLLLALEEGRPVSMARLSLAIWQDGGQDHNRHLSVLVARLRAKIAASQTHRLETQRKRGYGLVTRALALRS